MGGKNGVEQGARRHPARTQIYLFCEPYILQLLPERDGFFKLVAGDFYIHRQTLEEIGLPDEAPWDCRTAYQIESPHQFSRFFTAWRNNVARIYRGAASSHFSVPAICSTQRMVSEGDVDLPAYTGDGAQTRWLPGADDRATTLMICSGDREPFARELADAHPIPMGYSFSIRVGIGCGIGVAWFDPTEVQARGPLVYPQFEIDGIGWLVRGQVVYTDYPSGWLLDLPAARPYSGARVAPTAIDVRRWYEDSAEPWLARLIAQYPQYRLPLGLPHVADLPIPGMPSAVQHLIYQYASPEVFQAPVAPTAVTAMASSTAKPSGGSGGAPAKSAF